ncbi:MAG TPA: hypothetical protein VJ464_17615 [Blastocatellia bacterium]|nr:hypothetical protein [Blastocatellia bacterium]
MIKLARAVRHVERYSASDTRRGRPSRWPREEVVKVGSKLAEILDRETSGRTSIATFVDHYLRLLDFPADVLEALNSGRVNLFEAEQLARIKPGRLELSLAAARRKRAEILSAHLRSRASGERLRRRVNELLAPSKPAAAPLGSATDAVGGNEPLEDFDPYDSTHLFWEQIKQLGFAFREITREDLTDEDIQQLIDACDPVWDVLLRIKRRKQQPRRTSLIV